VPWPSSCRCRGPDRTRLNLESMFVASQRPASGAWRRPRFASRRSWSASWPDQSDLACLRKTSVCSATSIVCARTTVLGGARHAVTEAQVRTADATSSSPPAPQLWRRNDSGLRSPDRESGARIHGRSACALQVRGSRAVWVCSPMTPRLSGGTLGRISSPEPKMGAARAARIRHGNTTKGKS
jgi:hypothetical protein